MSLSNRFSSLLVLAAVCTAATIAPDAARGGELHVELQGGGQHAYDPSFDAFGRGGTPNVFGVGMLGAGYHPGDIVAFGDLAGFAALGEGATGGKRFDGAYDFRWRRALYLGGFEYGYRVTPAIRPFARVTVGVARQSVRVTPENGETFSQSRFQFVTRDSLGLELHTPFGRTDPAAPDRQLAISESVALGITSQIGYLWQPSQRFDSAEAPSDDDFRRSGIDLGQIDASGWFWAFGATLRIRL